MVVWTYDMDSIIPTCRDFEEKLIKLVWMRRAAFASLPSSTAPSTFASDEHLTEKAKTRDAAATVSEKPSAIVLAPKKVKTPAKRKRACDIFGYWKADASDVEKTAEGPSARPMRMFAPVYCGLGAALSLCELSVSTSIFGVPDRVIVLVCSWDHQSSSGAVPACCSRSPSWTDTGPASRFWPQCHSCSASHWCVPVAPKPGTYAALPLAPVRALMMHPQFFSLMIVTNITYVCVPPPLSSVDVGVRWLRGPWDADSVCT